MPRSKDEKDLFEGSTMTFGQHLEELRVCLFRAIVGLALGCVVGLLVGGRVAEFIQTPVQNALVDYYKDLTAKKSVDRAELAKLRAAGISPEGIQRFQEIIQKHINNKDPVSYEVVLVDPKEPLGSLAAGPAETVRAEQSDAAAGEADLKPVIHYHRLADAPETHLKTFGTQEAFMIYLKASFLVGAILAGPWVFYQIWTFVAAGLYPHEKRYVHVFLPMSILLFLAGASTAFFLVFKPVLSFLLSFNTSLVTDLELRINEWVGFVLMMPLAFGVSFQLPLVMLFMERIGIFTVEAYLSSWRIAVLAIFVLALILTPSGDPYSMCLMALPLCVLYFGGVLLCRFLPRRASAFEET
jgi:sec-independent protein translocase protein TatC